MTNSHVFGISLGTHSSTREILQVVAKKYTVYRNGAYVGEASNFEQLMSMCEDGDTFTAEFYDDIKSIGAHSMFDWQGSYICPDDDIGVCEPKAYEFSGSSLIIGSPTGCGAMIYKSVLEGGGLVETTQSDLDEFMRLMQDLERAGRLPADAKIGVKTACCS